MNNLNKYTTQQLKKELLNRQKCQQNNCSGQAELWVTAKLNSQEIEIQPICLPCAEQIEASLTTQRKAHITQHKSRIIKNHAPKL